MKTWLFNPFIYVAGARSLIIGWAIMLLTAVIGYYSHTHFDGAIDIHTGRIIALPFYLWEQLIDWSCAVLIFYPAGLIFSSSSIRFIDVAGTFALARWVMIFPAIMGFGINVPSAIHTVEDLKNSITGTVIVLAFLEMLFIAWLVALMYNAFVVSCNIKGGKATVVFIAGLVITELLSHIIIHLLY